VKKKGNEENISTSLPFDTQGPVVGAAFEENTKYIGIKFAETLY
jgi:hypothetical protein